MFFTKKWFFNMHLKKLTKSIITAVILLVFFCAPVFARQVEITEGTNWLIAQKLGNDFWGLNISIPEVIPDDAEFEITRDNYSPAFYRDTLTASNALLLTLPADPELQKAISWTSYYPTFSLEHLGRRIELLSKAGRDILTSKKFDYLLAHQNPDGGFGAIVDTPSSPLDTTFAIIAVKAAGYTDPTVAERAISYLASRQNPDGGFGFFQNSDSNIYMTSQALLAIGTEDTAYPAARANAVSYLLAGRNTDGGFGRADISTILDTSWAFRALVLTEADIAEVTPALETYLLARQTPAGSIDAGSWNSDVYTTALALQALGLMKPNLKAGAISISDPTAAVGETVTISAQVRNTGAVDAADVLVRIYDGDPDAGGVQIGIDQTVISIAAGGASSVQVSWTPFMPGPKEIFLDINPLFTIEEISTDDNRGSAIFSILTPADLAIAAPDIWFSPESPVPGDIVNINADIYNLGEKAADGVSVQIYEGADIASGIKLFDTVIAQIAGGALVSLSISLTPAEGEHIYWVSADSPGTISESDETNNIASNLLTVAPLLTNAPNLGFAGASPVSFTPSTAGAGSVIEISADITNSGLSGAANILIFAFLGDPDTGGAFIGSSLIPNLPVAATVTTSISWFSSVYDTGFSDIHIIIDPYNDIAESGEDDNRSIASIGLSLPLLPNLEVTSITYTPINPVYQDIITITAVITNNGTADAADTAVDIYMDAPNLSGGFLSGQLRWIGKLTIASIPAGSSAGAVAELIPVRTEAGIHTLTVAADPQNLIAESVETDNVMTAVIDIAMPLIPDLEAAATGITFSPAAPNSGDIVTISAAITNSGIVDADNTIIRFFDRDPAAGGVAIGSDTVITVPAGGSVTASVSFDTAGRVGTTTIFVQADPDGLISELSELNNTAFTGLEIAGVDLALFRSDISFSIPDPKPGDIISIFADVHNRGTNSASPLVEFYGGDPAIGGTLVGSTVITLPGGGTAMAEISWSVTTGVDNIFVTVDPADLIAESDETNNTTKRPLSMLKAAVIISNVAHSVNIISPQSSPFINDTSDISYNLSGQADLNMVIFGPDGGRVREYGPVGLKPAGHNVQRWDGLTDSGQVITTSGLYPYRIGVSLPDIPLEKGWSQKSGFDQGIKESVVVYSDILTLIAPDTDLYVDSLNPDQSFEEVIGQGAALEYGYMPGQEMRLYYMFDLAELEGVTVESAEFRFRVGACSGVYGCSGALLSVVDTPWSDSTITWNNQPLLPATSTMMNSVPSQICCGQDKSLDITALLKEWVSGTRPNNGIAILPDKPNYGVSVLSNFDVEWLNGGINAWVKPKLLVNGVDIASGRYPATGRWTVTYDSGGSVSKWGELTWNSIEPIGTTIRFRTRSAYSKAELAYAKWSDYYTTSGSIMNSPPQRWIEIEAELATADPGLTPQLLNVTLNAQRYIEPVLFPEKLRKNAGIMLDSATSGKSSAILLDDGSVRLYYSDGTNILSASSGDGLVFTAEAGVRLTADPLGPDSGGIGSPEITRLDNGSYRLYYSGSDALAGRILSAVSSDGLVFIKEGTVINAPPGYSMPASAELTILADARSRLYFSAYDGSGYQILSAISSDGVTFSIEPGIRGDGSSVSVYGNGADEFQMLAVSAGTIKRYTSANGLDFNYLDDFILNDTPLDTEGASHPEVLRLLDGTFRVYYKGMNALGERILSADFAQGGIIEVDNLYPIAEITAIDTISGSITGNAYDINYAGFNANFSSYILEYSPDGTTWNTITASSLPVTGGLLGILDTAAVKAGIYDFRISAIDTAGNRVTSAQQVLISSGPTQTFGHAHTGPPLITGPTGSKLMLGVSQVAISGRSDFGSEVELYRSTTVINPDERVAVTLSDGFRSGGFNNMRLTGEMLTLGEDSTNIALNKPASASDYHSQYLPQNANDGSLDSAWLLGNTPTLPEHLDIDLGQIYELARFKWINYTKWGVADKYLIYTSTTGRFTGEEILITKGDMPWDFSTQADYAYSIPTSTRFFGRYIRFALDSIIYSGKNAGLLELEVYAMYADSGSYTSDVLSASGMEVEISSVRWSAYQPEGTSLGVEVRSGNTAAPDSTWSPFQPVANNALMQLKGRYFQYRVNASATNTTPLLYDLELAGELATMTRVGTVAAEGGTAPLPMITATTQADFDAGDKQNLNSSAIAGKLLLALNDTTNIAFAKPATASSSYALWAYPGRTVDGYLTTHWILGDTSGWMQIDLGASYPLSRIKWYVYSPGKPQNYRIAVSETGQFTGEELLITSGILPDADGSYEYIIPDFITGRFIRFYEDSVYGQGGLTELEVYGGYDTTGGTFFSKVYTNEAGAAGPAGISLIADEPAGTSLSLYARSGNSLLADGTPDTAWNGWLPVDMRGDLSAFSGNYLQFRTDLTSSSAFASPVLDEVSFLKKGEQASFVFNNILLTPGSNTFTARAMTGPDQSGFSNTIDITFNNQAPIAVISSPASNSIIAGIVTITGSADSTYRLKYAPAGETAFTPLGQTLALAVTSGPLMNWDTTAITDGDYQLRLVVENSLGMVSTASTAVIIDNNLPATPVITTAPGVLNNSPAVINGTAEAGVMIEITTGTNIFTAMADTAGMFDIPDVLLGEGKNRITATAIDSAGSRSLPSTAITLTLKSVDMTINLDKSAYSANEPVNITISVTHLGSPELLLNGSVALEDAAGNQAGVINPAVSTSFTTDSTGAINIIPVIWNTATTTAGEYQVRVILSSDGLTYSDKTSLLTVIPDISFNAMIVTDMMSYDANQSVNIEATFANTSSNYNASNLSVTTTITSPLAAVVFAETRALGAMMTGEARKTLSSWPTSQNQPGFYTLRTVLVENMAVLAESSTDFSITASSTPAIALSGSMSVSPEMIFSGDPVTLTYSLTNIGNTDLADITPKILIVDTEFLTYNTILEPALKLFMQSSSGNTLTITTGNYSAKDYLVVLNAVINGVEEMITGGYFRVQGAPTAPSLNQPPDNTEVATFTPLLVVNNAADPNSDKITYQFEIYGNDILSMLISQANNITEGNGATAWIPAIPLSENNRYWWRARAFDGYSYSQWMPTASLFVNTVNDPPSAPQPVSPPEASHVTSLTPLLSVANASDPDSIDIGYNFEVASDPAFLNIAAQAAGVAETSGQSSWQLTVLLRDNTLYYWRAQADDYLDTGPWSSSASFFVNTANDSPSAPASLSPDQGSIVITNQPLLEVANSTDLDNDTLVYSFELDRIVDFNSPELILSTSIPEGLLSTSWQPPVLLKDNSDWFWHVRAFDSQAYSAYNSTRSFFVNTVNDPPSVPVLVFPAAGTEVLLFSPALILANASDPDRDELTYGFEVYADSGLTQLIAQANAIAEQLEQTSWTLPVLLIENATYYWRGIASDGLLLSGWSMPASFIVNTANDAPGEPDIIGPLTDTTVETLTPVLSVSNSIDPDNDTLTYQFELYIDPLSRVPVASASGIIEGLTSTSWSPQQPLSDNTQYWWKARAFDGERYSGWSVLSNFKVHIPQTGILVQAEVKIKPRSIKLTSHGKWIKAKLMIPGNYMPEDLDISSIRLNSIVPADTKHYRIKVKHKHEHQHRHGRRFRHNHEHENGHDHHHEHDMRTLEVKLKFKRSEVAAILLRGEEVIITITGNIGIDRFAGIDVVKVK